MKKIISHPELLPWKPVSQQLLLASPPEALVHWLVLETSLTAELKKYCRDFNVRVLSEGWQLCRDESALELLGCEYCRNWQRQVLLLDGDRPMVQAHTIIPWSTLHGEGRLLTHLGNRPLGEYIFTRPELERESIEFVRATTPVIAGAKPAHAWGRRSLYSIREGSLLVAEIFLPNFLSA